MEMEYVIGVILVAIVISIIVLLFRKRQYDQIDYYEGWKIDIMGRNIAGKLTNIKELSTEGEAREKLDRWKQAWDQILTEDLAEVEEMLVNAEHYADQFRLPSARREIAKLEQSLVEVEKRIDAINRDIDRLIETDKMNREEMQRLEPEIQQLQKRLFDERVQYDRAAPKYEVALEEVAEQMDRYQLLVESGSYSEASTVVDGVKERLAEIEQSMDEFPSLYKSCKFDLPTKLDEVYKNVQEMEAQGYYIDHLHTKNTINDLQAQLLDFVVALENLEVAGIKESLAAIEEQIESIYDALEQEVIAKNFVVSKSQTFSQSIERLLKDFKETEEEVKQLKETYHFEDKDLEKYMSLEKQMNRLAKSHEQFQTKNPDEHANTLLRDDLTANIEELERLDEEHRRYKKEIANLRKDELEARKQIDRMVDELSQAKRRLRQSNLPGIPNFILSLIEEAEERTDRANLSIEKQPLDIVQLQKTLEEARGAVDHALEQTNKIIEQAELTELVIQYANRYRSRDSILAAKLLEAEELFRKADYELALEQAADAVRERDPLALERIEEFYHKGSA